MKMKLICAAGLLALTGCGEGGGDANQAAARGGASVGADGRIAFRPGEWETTVETPTEGMPPEIVAAMGGGALTTRQCLTEAKAKPTPAELFSSEHAGACTADKVAAQDGRLRGTLTCKGEAASPTFVEVDGSFDAEGYDMTHKMRLPTGETTQIRVTARRVGECGAGAPGTAAQDPQAMEG